MFGVKSRPVAACATVSMSQVSKALSILPARRFQHPGGESLLPAGELQRVAVHKRACVVHAANRIAGLRAALNQLIFTARPSPEKKRAPACCISPVDDSAQADKVLKPCYPDRNVLPLDTALQSSRQSEQTSDKLFPRHSRSTSAGQPYVHQSPDHLDAMLFAAPEHVYASA
jgi:hypothetical protein